MRKQVLTGILLAASVMFGVSFDAFAQKKGRTMPAVLADDISVFFSFPDTPHVSYEKNTIGSPRKVDYKWMLVKVQYRFNSGLSVHQKPGFVYDNMRCEIAMRTIASKQGWMKNYWFTGTQQFYSVIPGKSGTQHEVLFFMPPPLLYKCTGGNKLVTKLFRDCIVYVRFYNAENKLIGRRIWAGAIKGGKLNKQMESTAVKAYNRMNDNPANKIVNGLWSQEKTPWQYLNADRVDLPLPVFDTKNTFSGKNRTEEKLADSNGKSEKDTTELNNEESTNNGVADAEATAENVEFTRPEDVQNRKKRRK
ncbi:MAG: hypothetical protein J6S53_11265 [Lentisphaeria bacterium]|nr:hypothetical protein [Lentisphaeria bacterium]